MIARILWADLEVFSREFLVAASKKDASACELDFWHPCPPCIGYLKGFLNLQDAHAQKLKFFAF